MRIFVRGYHKIVRKQCYVTFYKYSLPSLVSGEICASSFSAHSISSVSLCPLIVYYHTSIQLVHTGDERDAHQHAEAAAGMFHAHVLRRRRFRRVGRLLLATALFPVLTDHKIFHHAIYVSVGNLFMNNLITILLYIYVK